MVHPVDVVTGQQSGPELLGLEDEVLVGYLLTYRDGYQVRLGADKVRAEAFARQQRAALEPMFVKRPRAQQQGGA